MRRGVVCAHKALTTTVGSSVALLHGWFKAASVSRTVVLNSIAAGPSSCGAGRWPSIPFDHH